jgi:hypothetical protein
MQPVRSRLEEVHNVVLECQKEHNEGDKDSDPQERF